MRYYFLIVGVLCFLYFLLLAWYSRRLISTFAGFWLITGGVHLILGCAPFSDHVYQILKCAAAAAWVLFAVTEAGILTGMIPEKNRKADQIIILGAQVRGRYITNSLRRRLDAALSYLEKYPDTKVIVSGGQGNGEDISEAEAMAGYLAANGVDPRQIICEDQSTSTKENLRFSRKYLDPENTVTGIVTNDFHMFRAALIARREGYRKILRIPASSNPVFQLNYLVREFFAVLSLMIPGRRWIR